MKMSRPILDYEYERNELQSNLDPSETEDNDQLSCRRCGHTVTTRSNLFQHLRRKNICQPLCEDIEPTVLLKELLDEKKKHKTIKCNHCDAMFTTRQAKSLHMKTCKKASIVVTTEKIDAIVEKKIQSIIKGTKGTANVNINNGTINNNVNHFHINMTDFKSVNANHISSDEVIEMISRISREDRYYSLFQDLLQKIYFDKNHPCKHSLMIHNVRSDLCKIINKGSIEFAKKYEVIDMAIGTTHNTLHNVYEDNEQHHTITLIPKQIMNRLNHKFFSDDPKHMKKLRKDSTTTILNSREVASNTWNLLKSTSFKMNNCLTFSDAT